ncbi:MAG: O-antigen ligase family protein [Balneolaceae bacterium]
MMAGGMYYFDGNVPLVTGIIYLTLVLLLSLIRIDYSLYLFIFSVILFEQFAVPGFEPFTHDVSFFSNLKEISYVPFFEAGMISPFEIHILFITFALFLHITIRKDFTLKPITVWGAFLVFFTCFIMAFLNGMRGGGDFLVALWEVRALFYFCLMYLIVPQILNSKKQITILFWVIIIGVTIKALQGFARFVDLGFTTGGFAVLTNHEDPVFIVTLFVLLIGFLLYQTGQKQKLWLLVTLVILLAGFYVAQRRATYGSLIVSVTAILVILPALMRIKFLKYFFPVLTILLIYGFIFWNNVDSSVGRPVQMIKSAFVEPELETNFADYSSNLYRDNENYNLAQTVVNHTVMGTGFGKRYDQPIPLIDIRFTLRDYIPHNQIYWVLVKMGAVGFFAFWFFFNCFVAKGTQVFNRLDDPYLKAITLVIVIAVINQMVVSFYDLQLTYYRSMIYLGCLMGLLPVIEQIGRVQKSKDDSTNGGSNE